jgi:regulatory protein
LARGARKGGDRPEPTAYQRALGLLVRRERSRAELGRKLRAHGVDQGEAETALATLARQDFQNDARFAQAWARTRAGAGYGPVRIRAELAQHALPREAVAEALDACEADWDELARSQVRRRYPPAALADPAQRRKAVEWLLRRGFDTRCAAQAVGGVRDGECDD